MSRIRPNPPAPRARRINPRGIAGFALAALLSAAAGTASAAQVSGYFRHSAPGVFVNIETLQTAASGPISDSNSPILEIGGTYQVDYGLIRLSATHDGLMVDDNSFSNAGVTGWFQDGLTVNVPSLPDFSTVTLLAQLNISGNLAASGNGQASYVVNVSTPGGFGGLTQVTGTVYGDELGFPPGVIGDDFGSYLATLQVLNNVPFQLKVEGNADAGVTLNGVISAADSDLGSTIRWGGIVEARDELGGLISNFSITSESGYDYATVQVVPAPAGLWLLGTGLLGLAARRRLARR